MHLSMLSRNMLLAEVDSLRSQLLASTNGNRNSTSETQLQLQVQQSSAALVQANREKEDLVEYISKMNQQRGLLIYVLIYKYRRSIYFIFLYSCLNTSFLHLFLPLFVLSFYLFFSSLFPFIFPCFFPFFLLLFCFHFST